MNQKKFFNTQTMVKVSILSVISFIIMFIETPIMFFPEFLKLDISDVPALIAGFSLGPLAGMAVELLKNVLHLTRTSTAGVGELANFLIGSALVVPASYIYQKNKNKKSAFIGLLVGVVSMSIVGGLANIYILIPFYANVLNFPVEAIVQMGTAVNPTIDSLNKLVLYGVVPFNLLKGIVISIITLLIYKKISVILHR